METNLVAQRLAAEVRADMARKRVSQSTLAIRLDLSQAAVSRRLSGKVPFDVNELEAVAEVLGTTASRLLDAAQDEVPA